MAKADDVQNAFARIAGELQKKQKQPTITPYEQSALSINTGGSNYQYRNNFDDANQVRDKYNAAIDTRDAWEQGLNVPRRVVGAFGELVESTASGVANTAGAINRIGLDDQSQTAFIKLQDQKKNPEYQQELAQLRNNPMGLIRTGARIDMRDVNERIKFLENRLNQNQLSEQEYSSLYNPDGTETDAKQRLNWSQAAADNGEYLAGNRAKGKTGFLNAGNWYGHEGEKAYQGYKALHGTSDQENRKLTRDAQDAYDKGDYLTWAKNQGKAFLNSASESAEALKANPMYAVEEAAAMAPYIVPYTRGVAIAADAARVQNQSHDQFTDRELRTPTATETLGITAMTGVYTAANYAEAMLARGALRNEGFTKSLGLSSKVAPAVEQSAKASVLGSVTGNAGVQAFGRLASGMAGEGVTEAVQQQVESNWGSLDPTLDAQGMGEAFTMGAAIHGVLSGPSTVTQGAVGTALQAKASSVKKQVENAIQKNPELDKNTTTEELADVNSEKFSPSGATVRMVQEADKAPETAEEVKAKYQKMYDDTDNKIVALNEAIGIHENIDRIQGQLEAITNKRDQVLEANPDMDVSKLDRAIEMLSGQVKRHNTVFEGQEEADVYTQRETLVKELDRAESLLSRSKKLTNDTVESNPTNIPSVVLGSPSSYSAEELAKASKDVKYSKSEQTLLRELSEARQAYDDIQDVEGVTKDVMKGSAESKSILSYIDNIGKAVATNNSRLRNNTLRGITLFEASHTSKAEAVTQAWTTAQETGATIQVMKNGKGGWEINTGEILKGKDKKANGALDITYAPKTEAHSEKVVAAIQAEAEAISKVKAKVESIAGGTYEAKPNLNIDEAIDDTIRNNDDLRTAQEQAELGQNQEIANKISKAKATPKNTPVDPTENLWEGLDESGNTNVPNTAIEPVDVNTEVPVKVKDVTKIKEPTAVSQISDALKSHESNKADVDLDRVSKTFDAYTKANPEVKIITANDLDSLPPEYAKSIKNKDSYDAYADRATNTVVLYRPSEAIKKTKTSMLGLVTHELAHLATIKAMETITTDTKHPKHKELKKEVHEIREALKSWVKFKDKEIDAHVLDRIKYMIDSPNGVELPSVGTGESSVIAELKKIPTTTANNLFERIVGVLKEALGLTDSVTNIAERIATLADRLSAVDTTTETVVTKPTEIEPIAEEVVEDIQEDISTDTVEDVDSTDGEGKQVDALEAEDVSEALKAEREAEKDKALAEQDLVLTGTNKQATKLNSLEVPLTLAKDMQAVKGIILGLANEHLAERKRETPLSQAELGAIHEASALVNEFRTMKNNIVFAQAKHTAAAESPIYHNYAKYLIDGKPTVQNGNTVATLKPAVTDALAIASYAWLTENAGKTFRSMEEVGKLFGLKDVKSIPKDIYSLVGKAGTHKTFVAESIGNKAVGLLGYSFVKDVAPERKAKLAVALGEVALNQLLSKGYLTETVINGQIANVYVDTIRAMNGIEEVSTEDLTTQINLIGVPLTNKDEIKGPSLKLLEKSRKGASIVHKAFDLPKGKAPIRFKPAEKRQTTIDSMGTEAPSYQDKQIEYANSRKWNISTDTHTFYQTMQKYPDNFKAMAGIKSDAQINASQAMERDSIRAKNNAISLELQTFADTLEILADRDAYAKSNEKPEFGIERNFYLQQDIWGQQRSGMKNDLNPVASKVHRALVNMKDHKVDIDIDYTGLSDFIKHGDTSVFYKESTGDVTVIGEFLQTVALASEDFEKVLGLKTTADKTNVLNYAPQYLTWMLGDGKPVMDIMAKINDGLTPTQAEVDTITEVVGQMGMNLISVKALTNMARFVQAYENVEDTFTSDISIEIDGVTNGPWLTQMLLNVGKASYAKAGGAYTQADVQGGISNVPAYKDAGNKDTYEQNADVMVSSWAKVKQDIQKNDKTSDTFKANQLNFMEAIDSLYPKFRERKGAKTLTTVINFGSGVTATAQGIVGDLTKSIIGQLSSVKQGTPEAVAVINNINTLIQGSTLLDINADPLEIELDNTQLKALGTNTAKILKPMVRDFMEAAYGDYVKVRDSITGQMEYAYRLFDVMYQDTMESAVSKAADINVEGLSAEQHKEVLKGLHKYLPTVETAMAARSENKENASLPAIKSGKTTSNADHNKVDLYIAGAQVPYKEITPKYPRGNNTKSGSIRHIQPKIKSLSFVSPGVRMLPFSIHSFDAYIAHTMIGSTPSMNVHDAISTKVGNGRNLGVQLNKTTLQGIITTHINSNFVKGLLKPIKGLATDFKHVLGTEDSREGFKELINDLAVSQGLIEKKDLKDKAGKLLKQFTNAQVLPILTTKAYDRDISKLEGIKQYIVINQYGLEGGEYKVTKEDLVTIDKQINDLKKEKAENLKEITKLADTLDGLVSGKVKPEAKEESVPSTIQDPLSHYLTNTLGKVNNLVLMKVLKDTLNNAATNPNAAGLANLLSSQTFGAVLSTLPKDFKVITLDKSEISAYPDGVQMYSEGKPAWFNSNYEGTPTVFMIKQDDGVFQASILVHELIHVSTYLAVRSNDPKVQKAKAELNDLFEAYKKAVKAKGNASENLKYSTSSIDEFIAMGLSDEEVMPILYGLRFKRDGRAITAVKAFVQGVVKILNAFGFKSDNSKGTVDGVTALIINVRQMTAAYNSLSDSDKAVDIVTGSAGAPKQKAKQSVLEMNTLNVLDALTGTGTSFDQSIKDALRNVAVNILDRFDTGLFNQLGLSNDPESVWLDAVAKGQTPAINEAAAHGFNLTDKERFAVETLYAAISGVSKDRNLSLSYSELNKSFTKAKAQIKPENLFEGDWSTASKVDKDAAQLKWDYAFKITNAGDHLARFGSMVLGSEYFASKMDFNNKDQSSKANTTYEKFLDVLNKIIEYIGMKLVGAKVNQRMDNHVYDVLKGLAKVDLKHRNLVSNQIENQIAKFDTWMDKGVAKAKEKIVDLTNKESIKESKNAFIGIGGDVVRSAAKDKLWEDLNQYKQSIMSATSGPLGFVGELMNEISDNSPFKNVVEKLMRQVKMSSQYKEGLSEATQKNLLGTYKDGGKNLTKKQKHAITGMLRADVQMLTGKYSAKDIQRMYEDPAYLRGQINLFQGSIKNADLRATTIISRTKDLARYMMTGLGAKNNDLAKNAMLIAMGAGTTQRVSREELSTNLVSDIDMLASLYAIQYTSTDDKQALSKVMKDELSSKVNGIDTTLKFHKSLSEEAQEELFKENPLSATKGYVPDITNPNHEVRFATTDEEAEALESQFFKEVKTLTPNKLVTGNNVRMFLSENSGQTRMISGALEVFSQNSKGTKVNVGPNLNNVIKSIQAKQSQHKNTKYDPYENADASAMIPSYDLDGNIIGFSYEMAGNTRDALLQRNNDFSQLLGQYAATNYNKLNVPAYNEKVIDAVVSDYEKNYDKNPRNYLVISHASSNPELQRMWDMLPQTTRDYIRNKTGKGELIVSKEVLLPIFGYQKYSVISGFDKDQSNRNMYEKIFVGVMKTVFGINARVYGTRIERGMQEAVGLAKNMIVIRNVRTLVMNIMSNTFLLQAHGASLTDIIKDTVVSLRAGIQYRKDSALLLSKQQRLAAGVGSKDKLEQEILQLEQSLANNPLIDFINEGMMPSIVDDVALKAQDDYSYQSALGRKLDKVVDKIPEPLIMAGKWLMVDPSTPLYEFLNNTTQLSDFTAKYAMYNYYTKNAGKKHQLNHEEAIQMSSDNFINYDMPTSKGMQYLNDMGILMFTKYNLRIQKALFKLLEKRPARALMQALVMHHGTDIPFGIDPIIWNQIGFPLRDGALILPDALGEPIPVNVLGSLL